jgi:prepilin-type N-terminal cleavage/methylation domain-containing protein/prepilin-type processing-associated H-X9-DG protein
MVAQRARGKMEVVLGHDKRIHGIQGSEQYLHEGTRPMRARQRKSAKGFTLVELLVVIGIIALLISILLPAMNKAKKAANTLACMANLRSIAQAMQIYAGESRGYILGSAVTTGAFLTQNVTPPYTDFNCPEICQTWDWQSPVARVMKVKYDTGSALANRAARFLFLTNYGPFVCPENDLICPPYSGSPIKVVTKMISYNTANFFLQGSGFLGNSTTYIPKITKVGASSQKIFMSDGGRWTDGTTAPDYNETYSPSVASNDYSDYGVMDAFSRAFLPGTPMLNSMRHGARTLNRPLGDYKFNAVFFDGHAETLDARTAMNPTLWLPKGASLGTPPNSLPVKEFTTQTVSFYNINVNQPYIVSN